MHISRVHKRRVDYYWFGYPEELHTEIIICYFDSQTQSHGFGWFGRVCFIHFTRIDCGFCFLCIYLCTIPSKPSDEIRVWIIYYLYWLPLPVLDVFIVFRNFGADLHRSEWFKWFWTTIARQKQQSENKINDFLFKPGICVCVFFVHYKNHFVCFILFECACLCV